MSTPSAAAASLRARLEPHVRPREEALQIRRVLAAHLAASLPHGTALDSSLALAAPAADVAPAPDARGLQRAYLEALQANVEARRAFEAVLEAGRQEQKQKEAESALPAVATDAAADRQRHRLALLEDHLASVQLGRKKARLQAVHRCLDELMTKPAAAAEDFLQPEAIYAEATLALPPVPQAVVDGMAEEAADADTPASAAARLQTLVAQLEAAVLRAQLRLKQEEKRLAAAKMRARPHAAGPDDAHAKLAALGAARNELIAWMEAELRHATDSDEDELRHEDDDEMAAAGASALQLRQSLLGSADVDGADGDPAGQSSRARIEARVAAIGDQYARYVAAREALVRMVGSKAAPPLFANMPSLPPRGAEREPAAATATATATADPARASASRPVDTVAAEKAAAARAAARQALSNVLLTPYLERLLAVARAQKADIAHKAHYQALLARHQRETCRMLDHLADESQLLLRHPLPRDSRAAASAASAASRTRAFARAASTGFFAAPSGLGPAGQGPDNDITQRTAAWTFAADAAKLATFEAVAEHLDQGQTALEQATRVLDEIDSLLGRPPPGPDDEDDAAETGNARKGRDIWEALHGELGLIRADK